MANFNLRRIFRGTSGANLKGIFDQFKITVPGMNWEAKKLDIKRLTDFFKELKPGAAEDFDSAAGLYRLFQELREVADTKVRACRVIREVIKWSGKKFELPEDFDSWTAYNQAAYIYLNCNELWKPLVSKMQVDEIQLREKWREYGNLPAKEIDFEPVKNAVASAICEFFRPEKKCRSCQIERYAYTRDVHYFFATLDDEPSYIEAKVSEEEDFEFQKLVTPFRVAFAYNHKEGEFALYAENLTGKEKDTLADCILTALLVLPGNYSKISKERFDLTPFNDFDFELPLCPGISAPRVKSITLVPFDDPDETLFFSSRTRSAYDSVKRRMRVDRNNGYTAKRVTIALDVTAQGLAFERLTFELGEKTCTLKSMSEDRRIFGEKLLKNWGLKK